MNSDIASALFYRLNKNPMMPFKRDGFIMDLVECLDQSRYCRNRTWKYHYGDKKLPRFKQFIKVGVENAHIIQEIIQQNKNPVLRYIYEYVRIENFPTLLQTPMDDEKEVFCLSYSIWIYVYRLDEIFKLIMKGKFEYKLDILTKNMFVKDIPDNSSTPESFSTMFHSDSDLLVSEVWAYEPILGLETFDYDKEENPFEIVVETPIQPVVTPKVIKPRIVSVGGKKRSVESDDEQPSETQQKEVETTVSYKRGEDEKNPREVNPGRIQADNYSLMVLFRIKKTGYQYLMKENNDDARTFAFKISSENKLKFELFTSDKTTITIKMDQMKNQYIKNTLYKTMWDHTIEDARRFTEQDDRVEIFLSMLYILSEPKERKRIMRSIAVKKYLHFKRNHARYVLPVDIWKRQTLTISDFTKYKSFVENRIQETLSEIIIERVTREQALAELGRNSERLDQNIRALYSISENEINSITTEIKAIKRDEGKFSEKLDENSAKIAQLRDELNKRPTSPDITEDPDAVERRNEERKQEILSVLEKEENSISNRVRGSLQEDIKKMVDQVPQPNRNIDYGKVLDDLVHNDSFTSNLISQLSTEMKTIENKTSITLLEQSLVRLEKLSALLEEANSSTKGQVNAPTKANTNPTSLSNANNRIKVLKASIKKAMESKNPSDHSKNIIDQVLDLERDISQQVAPERIISLHEIEGDDQIQTLSGEELTSKKFKRKRFLFQLEFHVLLQMVDFTYHDIEEKRRLVNLLTGNNELEHTAKTKVIDAFLQICNVYDKDQYDKIFKYMNIWWIMYFMNNSGSGNTESQYIMSQTGQWNQNGLLNKITSSVPDGFKRINRVGSFGMVRK